MAILDKFDRVLLGSNWESPSHPPSVDNGPLIMIAGKDGVEMNPIDVSDERCTGIYIAEGEFQDQYAEVEIIDPINFAVYSTYYTDYAAIGVLLNTQLAATGSEQQCRFRLIPNLGYTSYDEVYFDCFVRDVAGVSTFVFGGYHDYTIYFDNPVIPIGTRVRLEKIGDVYTGFLYSPDRGRWFELGSGVNAQLTGGYPGINIYSTDSADDAQVSNFRAGGRNGDIFLSSASYKEAKFECIAGVQVQRDRYPASEYDTAGDWNEGVPESVMLEGVVHPVTAKTNLSSRMIQEIDNNRNREWVVIYSPFIDQEISPGVSWREGNEDGQYSSDIMTYRGEKYEIAMVDKWQAGMLDHIKAIAKKLDVRDGR